MEAEYACLESEEELGCLRGSKYIPTQKRVLIDGEYLTLWPLVARKLNDGREVLFIGLGCDVAALYSYLNANHIDTSRLFTADLICYGPTLPEVHSQYVSSLEAKYHSRLKSFTVRHKAEGWTPPYIRAEFEDGREFLSPFYETEYGKIFGIYSREVCYECKFRGKNHRSDVTLGDYWGLTPDMPGWNKNGVSIFITRTPKGEELVRRIPASEFTVRREDPSFVIEHNKMYYTRRTKPEDYAKFCADLKSRGLHRAWVNHDGGRLKYWLRLIKKMLKKILRRG